MPSSSRVVVVSVLFITLHFLTTWIVLTTWIENKQNSAQTVAVPSESRALSAGTDVTGNAIADLYAAVSHERLQGIANEHNIAYAEGEPFPHIAIDGIFPESFLKLVSAELANINGGQGFRNAREFLKSNVSREGNMGIHTRIFYGVLKSSNFIHFLETLTGIQHIIPDPHYHGSGVHITKSGGFLNVHADFNKYGQYNIDRRVNTFVYMNEDWSEEYGGHLELWSMDMKSCHQKILPTFGRFVVFSSTDFSYHGHPQPLAAPSDRSRRSLALYYFTNGRPAGECKDGNCSDSHSTLFQTPQGCEVCDEQTCKRYDENKPVWAVAD